LTYFEPRLIAVLFMGFSSGLPLALTTGTLQVWQTRAGVSLATIGFFALVGAVYSLLLAGTQVLTGGDRYANVVMHYAMPVLVLLFWLACAPKGALRARDPLVWAAYPLTYLVYVLARGGIDGAYPYFFLDVGKIGLAAALTNAAAISAGFLVAGYLIVWLDRRLAKAAPAALLEPAPPGA